MTSKQLYDMLESMKDEDIELVISMSIRFLEKKRDIRFKDILSDIKVYREVLERRG